jgi:PIN domain nuclease of toxin-antitoxin system
LALPADLRTIIATQREQNGIQILQIELEHIYGLSKLEFFHNDPFDRVIVSQAILETMTLISNDEKIVRYPVTRLW